MDELRLRLEYLETACQGRSDDDTLLAKVDAMESSLVSMLGIKQHEAQRLASELERRIENSQNTSEDPPNAVKQAILLSKFDELAKLATELETQLPLEIPDVRPPPNSEELISKASELGKEFDELTARSTELTKRLLEQVTKENAVYGGLASRQ